MGVDWLDLSLRMEREFGIKFTPDLTRRYAPEPPNRYRGSATAGEVLDMVIAACESQQRPVPKSAWNRVKRCIVQTGGVSPKLIRKTSRLHEDLGLT